MKLKCIKTYHHMIRDGATYSKLPRIIEGQYYEVLQQHTKTNGDRYWLFRISDSINPNGSGWFVIDDYFETPEQVREKTLNEILQ